MLQRVTLTAILMVAAGLTAALWLIATIPVDLRPIAIADVAGPPRPPGGAAAWIEPPAPLASAATETRQRPLFQPARRPYVRPVEPVPPPVALPPPPPEEPRAPVAPPAGLRLMGIVGEVGGARRALIATTGRPVAVWLAAGDGVEDWRIATIEADRVVLARGEARHAVTLYPAAPTRGAVSNPR